MNGDGSASPLVTGATSRGLTEAQISKVPFYLDRVVAALSVLGAPGSGGGAPRTPGSLRWTRRSTGTTVVTKMSQYVGVDSLIIGLVYLVRFLQHEQKRQAQRPEEPPATAEDVYLWYVTAVVLADKFTNDDSYDDILPAMGIVSELPTTQMRQEESRILACLLQARAILRASLGAILRRPRAPSAPLSDSSDPPPPQHATMFVSPAEFHETILAVQHHPFHRMERAAALDALDEALQRDGGAGIAHASATAAAVAAGAAPPSPGVLRRPGPASRMAERFRALTGRRLMLPSAPTPGTAATTLPASAAGSAPASPRHRRRSTGSVAIDPVGTDDAPAPAAAAAAPAPPAAAPPVGAPARRRQRRYTWSGERALALVNWGQLDSANSRGEGEASSSSSAAAGMAGAGGGGGASMSAMGAAAAAAAAGGASPPTPVQRCTDAVDELLIGGGGGGGSRTPGHASGMASAPSASSPRAMATAGWAPRMVAGGSLDDMVRGMASPANGDRSPGGARTGDGIESPSASRSGSLDASQPPSGSASSKRRSRRPSMDDLPIVVEDTVEEMDGGGNHAPPAQRKGAATSPVSKATSKSPSLPKLAPG